LNALLGLLCAGHDVVSGLRSFQEIFDRILSRVAIDRGLRLAEKRQLPLGDRRQKWLDARDALYEEIQVRPLSLLLHSTANTMDTGKGLEL
jgi:hypothetical protein